MGFRDLMEEIGSIIDGKADEQKRTFDYEKLYEGIDVSRIREDEWTPETSVAWIAGAISGLSEQYTGGDEAEILKFLSDILAEGYKWTYSTSPEDRDVSSDIGTIDEPPKADIPRGFRGSASGMTPSAQEWYTAVIKTMMKKPPKPVAEFPVETSVEVWNDILGKAINKGIGIKWEMDKKTGIQFPSPDYSVLYGMWKDAIAKLTGLRPTRERDEKMAKGMDDHRKDMAKELAKGAAVIGKKLARQASTTMRGARSKGSK